MKNSVTIHTSIPIDSLRVGQKIQIGNEPKSSRRHKTQNSEPTEFTSSNNESISISESYKDFPPEVDYSKQSSLVAPKSSHSNNQIHYNKVTSEMENFNKITSRLANYQENKKRKNILIHQDWEEKYMSQLDKRMKKKFDTPKYKATIKERKRALTALGSPRVESNRNSSKRSAFSTQRMPQTSRFQDDSGFPIFHLEINTAGLDDRVHKYQHHSAVEDRLTKFIQGQTGKTVEKPSYPERDLLSAQMHERSLAQTRFFSGCSEENPKKGKQYFPQKYYSSIQSEIISY